MGRYLKQVDLNVRSKNTEFCLYWTGSRLSQLFNRDLDSLKYLLTEESWASLRDVMPYLPPYVPYFREQNDITTAIAEASGSHLGDYQIS